jgi:ESS family glutamate:Na+ symporter
MTLESGLFGIAFLLLIGVVLRAVVRPLQWLFVPAAIIGGLIGLGLVQLAVRTDFASLREPVSVLAGTWSRWPIWLIAVVFAGLLLERPHAHESRAVRGRHTLLAGMMVWIIVVGQIALGFGAVWWMAQRGDVVPAELGQMIEAGFAGGHGTASALGAVHAGLGKPEMLDYGMFTATFGLIFSVISGVIFVNIAIRLRWTKSTSLHLGPTSGLESRAAPPAVARAPIAGDVIDPFVWALVLISIVMLIGSIFQGQWTNLMNVFITMNAGSQIESPQILVQLRSLPLFLFTLIAGGLVRMLMQWCGVADLIDPGSIKRIVGIAMEVLIVAAIASLRIELIDDVFAPLLILCGIGAAWCAVCLFIVSPIILPRQYWFELGIINYGMSTGTTAQGMMLLRMVDPELERGAAETYALAAPLSAPFIGGGILTMLLPLWLMRFSGETIAITAGIIVVVVFIAAVIVRRRG